MTLGTNLTPDAPRMTMGTFVESMIYGPIALSNPVAWTAANRKLNELLSKLQSKGAVVSDVKIHVESRDRVGFVIIYLVLYKAESPIEV